VVAGRRRTDVPDALWRGAPPQLSDRPTAPPQERSSRRRDGLLESSADRRPPARSSAGSSTPEPPRQMSRSRLPLPPVPAATRPPAKAAPRTSAAPFRAVPTPESLPHGDDSAAAPGPSDRPVRMSGPAPRVPRQTTAAGAGSSAFGDWTPQPRPGGAAPGLTPALPGDLLVRQAPRTTAIPERPISRRNGSADVLDDHFDDHFDDAVPLARPGRPAGARGPGTGPVGGRAAMRAERQAADMARRKAAKRSGAPAVVLDPEDDDEPRKPRRVLKGLVAMAIVGLGVLGVYTVVSPPTEEAGAETPLVASTAPSAPSVEPLPTLPSEPIAVEPVPATPIRLPVTVLNATDINGLAGKISETVVGGGWESSGVGAYLGGDVPVTTVFFTEGDENQRQAAVQLIEMYPQITGPAPRFFELPPDVPAPGLVVVAAGEWVP
jgi:hypothetical protein